MKCLWFFTNQGLDQTIVNYLNIWTRKPNLDEWKEIVYRLQNPSDEVNIAIVGKYTDVVDSYKSVEEASIHAGIENKLKVNISYIDAESLTHETFESQLEDVDGIIVPGGFGERGILGKLLAIEYARTYNKPFLGICLGLQLACVEFARNVLKNSDANSLEFAPKAEHLVINLMNSQKDVSQKGGTMRLGNYPCKVKKGTKAFEIYQSQMIDERHRHRYEFNNSYRKRFEDMGIIFSEPLLMTALLK